MDTQSELTLLVVLSDDKGIPKVIPTILDEGIIQNILGTIRDNSRNLHQDFLLTHCKTGSLLLRMCRPGSFRPWIQSFSNIMHDFRALSPP